MIEYRSLRKEMRKYNYFVDDEINCFRLSIPSLENCPHSVVVSTSGFHPGVRGFNSPWGHHQKK